MKEIEILKTEQLMVVKGGKHVEGHPGECNCSVCNPQNIAHEIVE